MHIKKDLQNQISPGTIYTWKNSVTQLMVYSLLPKCNSYPYVIFTKPTLNTKAVIEYNELTSGFGPGNFNTSLIFLTGSCYISYANTYLRENIFTRINI